ncbi:MAG: hypothetical protein FVQ85_02990 [Planctomycetes bacterium]|nr:hypothetical protein [Planctomycetota bacterium]
MTEEEKLAGKGDYVKPDEASKEVVKQKESLPDLVDRLTKKGEPVPELIDPTVEDNENEGTVDDQIKKLWPDG